KSFFKTKAGGLTLAFIVIMIAFVVIMVGIASGSRAVESVGFIVMLLALMYAPFQTYILKRK
ncbi:MAG: hypothetical protein U0K57_02675, partial [Lachnospiraceae bacterium]|nr:hypothetical protein [Lachnospiraceae bacterium]